MPISTDTGFGADGWGAISALGVDYFNGAIRTLGTGIGWDRYGRGQVGAKATYSFTPALDAYVVGSGLWTAKSVDTDEAFADVPLTAGATGGNLFQSVLVPDGRDPDGDENYLGTEVTAGLTWRFAPGLTLDLAVRAPVQRGGPEPDPEHRLGPSAGQVNTRRRRTWTSGRSASATASSGSAAAGLCGAEGHGRFAHAPLLSRRCSGLPDRWPGSIVMPVFVDLLAVFPVLGPLAGSATPSNTGYASPAPRRPFASRSPGLFVNRHPPSPQPSPLRGRGSRCGSSPPEGKRARVRGCAGDEGHVREQVALGL